MWQLVVMSDLFSSSERIAADGEPHMGAQPVLDLTPFRVPAKPVPQGTVLRLVQPLPHPEPPAARARPVAPFAAASALLAGLWASLNPGDPQSWLVGAPAVLAGAATVVWLRPPRAGAIHPLGALRFVLFFARQSVRGATDVALRALDPRLSVEPAFVEVDLNLPPGAARVAFANAVTLLPGTLTADLRGDRAVIHVIDRTADNMAELREVEARVRAIFADGSGA
jgi:multicomponent Na+:H+ antiporter subunit E